MGVTYSPADNRIIHAAEKLRKEFHKPLDEAGVTICYLMVFAAQDKSGNPKGPALMLHGYPCAAVVSVNNLKQRAQGLMDCLIQLDGDDWSDRPDEEKLAILDHELTHIEVFPKRKTNDGVMLFETDDLNRPVTKLRNHDFHGGGFKSIMHRHQGAALETKLAIDASLKMQSAIGFDPTPAVALKIAEPGREISFRDAIWEAIAEGRIGKESPAALWLKGKRDVTEPSIFTPEVAADLEKQMRAQGHDVRVEVSQVKP